MHYLEHLPKHPEFNFEVEEDPHKAKAVVAHFGCHAATGDLHGEKIYLTVDTLMSHHLRSGGISHSIDQLHEGAFRTITEAVNALFERIDSDLYNNCIARCKALPKRKETLAGQETYTLRALLVNTSTEDHIDESDAHSEFAVLVPAGNFTGKT
jgi:hypothetical protein